MLYTFVPNKSFGSLLDISPSNNIFLKTFNSEYDEIIVWFTDQNSKTLEIEDIIHLTMVIKKILNAIPLYKNEIFIRAKIIYVKGYGFISFARSMSNK